MVGRGRRAAGYDASTVRTVPFGRERQERGGGPVRAQCRNLPLRGQETQRRAAGHDAPSLGAVPFAGEKRARRRAADDAAQCRNRSLWEERFPSGERGLDLTSV